MREESRVPQGVGPTEGEEQLRPVAQMQATLPPAGGGVAAAGAASEAASAADSLVVLTYNIWFDEKMKPQRAVALMAEIEWSNAQVVGLQEVTQSVLRLLLQNPYLTTRYAFSSALCAPPAEDESWEQSWDANTGQGGVTPYGCLLLVDKGLDPLFRAVALPSEMGRSLIVATLRALGGLQCATVHLVSRPLHIL